MPAPHGGNLVSRILENHQLEKARQTFHELAALSLDPAVAVDVENIAHGVFSPLEGFLKRNDYDSVLSEKRLADGTPWPIPIVLDIERSAINGLRVGDEIALRAKNGFAAILAIEDIYEFDKREMAGKVFLTESGDHPGVARVYGMEDLLVGGKLTLVNGTDGPLKRYFLPPAITRRLFERQGWKTAVGFQTRNVPHLGHEYLHKMALTLFDGLFLNPVVGKKKRGDFRDEVILAAYSALIEHYYPKERVILSTLETSMRYAGPREAIFHAIIRKNFGCTHIIVGRDHAGVGNFYAPYAAQEIFREFPDLGIEPLFFPAFFYCERCGGVANEKTCPHDARSRIEFSGTRTRGMVANGEKPSEELVRPEVSEVVGRWTNPFALEE